ncbi:hypothetical protein ACIOBL_26945 [Paenibacillus taichungensis]
MPELGCNSWSDSRWADIYRYAYVNGNPMSYNEPLGLSKWETKGDR